MSQTAPCAADWYRGLTLTERSDALRSGAVSPHAGESSDAVQRLRLRLKRWRVQHPLQADAEFGQRLRAEGITESTFESILLQADEDFGAGVQSLPGWIARIIAAYGPASRSLTIENPVVEGPPETAFIAVVEPLLQSGCRRLREWLASIDTSGPALPFDPTTVERILSISLRRRLVSILLPTLVLELNVARVQGELEGANPQQRFANFVERSSRVNAALAFLQEYPVLARCALSCIDQWVTNSLELLQRLRADTDDICAELCLGHLGVLTDLTGGAGDVHRDGRSVSIASFSSGARIIYKPRSLGIDIAFGDLLSWVNARGANPDYRVPRVIDRGSYGWAEFVVAAGCSSETELRHFYERQGGYIALLYALRATDLHFENIIAAGPYPILIDLEALFHPTFDSLSRRDGSAGDAEFGDSVLSVGLLPQRAHASATSPGLDVSGLGGRPGQLSPDPLPQVRAAGTDEMQFTREHAVLPGYANRPSIVGRDVDPSDHADDVERGFVALYRLLLEHRRELLADDGPVARCANAQVRVIRRNTNVYAKLLRDALHPDVLRDALERDRLFDRLWSSADTAGPRAQLVVAERKDLHRGDIPVFTTFPGSRDVWTASGRRICDVFRQSGLDAARARIERLGDDDLERQRWYIRASFATLTRGVQRPRQRLREPSKVATPADYLHLACVVGEKLAAKALVGEDSTTWANLRPVGESYLTLGPVGNTLYDGLPGIALFFARLGALSGNDRFTYLAQKTLHSLRRSLEREPQQVAGIGALDGWGGVIYTFSHLSALWDRPDLREFAEHCVGTLEPLIDADASFDLTGGAAGGILGLLSLYRIAPSVNTLRAAIRCGEHLRASAQAMEPGIGWSSAADSRPPLAGYSHGAAGIAHALLALAGASGDRRFERAARSAVAYERSLFHAQAENWLDLRQPAETQPTTQCMTAWCHGAPGIGLARLASLNWFDDAAVRAEIETALRTTEREGFGWGHSLCHGDLGNLELLTTAADVLDDEHLHLKAARIGSAVLERIRADGPQCGPSAVETPGLLTGLAGIGYGLLRLVAPQRVPSVLTLAPPKCAPARFP